MEVNRLHFNLPQIKFNLAQAQTNILIWGRRTGKTEGALAPFTLMNILKMPRSNGFIIAASYEQMLTRTLQPLVAGWERLGYYEGVHFWVRRFPPDRLNLPKPFRRPIKPDYFISWFNGSGIYLVSQDVVASINGVATQWGCGDEAKFLDVHKLREEALLTFSGGIEYRNLSNYRSLCFTTDMPTDRSGDWLFSYEELMDKELIDKIIQYQHIYNSMLHDILTRKLAPNTVRIKYQTLQNLDDKLNELRKGSVFYSEASSLDNIHLLGVDTVKGWIRDLDEREFNPSVLNKRQRGASLGFYPLLSMERHGYTSTNEAYMNTLPDNYRTNYEKDCRWSNDQLNNKPLSIAVDINAAIKCCVVGQMNEHLKTYKLLYSHYVLNPKQLEDLVIEFDNYWHYHPVKVIHFHHDHTMDWELGNTGTTYADDFIKLLERKGWKVIPYYIGQQPEHKVRYKLWNKMLGGEDISIPLFRFNKVNAYAWYLSATECAAIDQDDRIKKDKRPEKNKSFPQEEAPHLSDAADTLIWSELSQFESASGVFVDVL